MDNNLENSRPNWLNRFEILLIGATAVLSGLVSLLDLLGILDGIPWLAERIPTLTLLVTGLIAGYLVLERRNQLESMQKRTEQRIDEMTHAFSKSTTAVIDSLQGVEVRQFGDGNDLLRYVNKRLLQARQQIDDLSWSPTLGLGRGLKITQEASAEHEERFTRVARRIPYREVFVFNHPGRIEKLKQRVNANLPGYSCAYYDVPKVPLIQFMIIDSEEVVVLSDQFETKFAMKHPHIVKLFTEYYEEIWSNATPLKVGTTINEEEVQRILSKAALSKNGT